MYTHTYAHENTCASMTQSTRWSTDTKTHNLCTNMHTHTHTHVYKRIDVQIHTHMHIYTCIHVRTHTHIHIYTHTHTKCTFERTQSTSETTARQRLRGQPNLTPRSSDLLPVRITTAHRPDHIRLSALVRSRSTQFASSQLGHGPLKRGHFSAILAVFFDLDCTCCCDSEMHRRDNQDARLGEPSSLRHHCKIVKLGRHKDNF